MDFSFGFGLGSSAYLLSGYNPLINYDWSTTTTSGLRYLKDVGSTPTYNASMYFGRGAYLNGVDQYLDTLDLGIELNSSNFTCMLNFKTTVATSTTYVIYISSGSNYRIYISAGYFYIGAGSSATKSINTGIPVGNNTVYNLVYSLLNGICSFSANNQTFSISYTNETVNIRAQLASNYGGYLNQCIIKDVYMFNRAITQAEITQAYEQPEAFYAMAQADSTCVLNMPMCENSSTSRNYKTGIDYQITNYTSSVRGNANRLQYGLQTCKFVRNSLGVIQSASSYLECDGAGYANTGWTPDLTKKLSIEFIVKNNDNLIDNILIGCIDDPTNRLALGFRGTNARILLGNAYPQYAIASTIYYGTLTITGIAGQSIVYINGEYKGLVGESTLGIPLSMFWLGGIPLASYKKIDTRLFKVHNKVLTQAEVTANYNSYVAKGLLS